jgi:hypothetical protein
MNSPAEVAKARTVKQHDKKRDKGNCEGYSPEKWLPVYRLIGLVHHVSGSRYLLIRIVPLDSEQLLARREVSEIARKNVDILRVGLQRLNPVVETLTYVVEVGNIRAKTLAVDGESLVLQYSGLPQKDA